MLNLYGQVSYNGFQFPGSYETEVRIKNEYSSDGFNQKQDVYEFTIKFIYTEEMVDIEYKLPTGSTDLGVQRLRTLLMERGKLFTYTYQGFSPDFKVNGIDPTELIGADWQYDIAGGPKPISFSFEPIATNAGAVITYVIEVVLPPCSANRYNTGVVSSQMFKEFYYKRNFDIDASGCATITTQGYYELKDAKANIDLRRGLLYFQPIPGTIRETKSFEINADHKSANFIFIDKEVPGVNAFYSKSIRVQASHTLNSGLQKSGSLKGSGFLSWDNEIEATITVPKSPYLDIPFYIFLHILRQRIYRVHPKDGRESAVPVRFKNEDNKEEEIRPRAFLTQLTMTENIFSNSHSFSAKYFAVYNREKFLNQSGLFRPFFSVNQKPNTSELVGWEQTERDIPNIKEPWHINFDLWSNNTTLDKQWLYYYSPFLNDPAISKSYSIFGSLYASESSKDTPSTIFDPCGIPTSTGYPININTPNYQDFNMHRTGFYLTPLPPGYEYDETGEYKPTDNELDASYLDYDVNISVVESANTYQLTKQCYDYSVTQMLQSGGPAAKEFTKQTKTFSINNNVTPSAAYEQTVKRESSYSSGSNFAIIMSGYSVRVGRPSPIPSLLSYKGLGLFKGGTATYSQKQIAMSNNPVYFAAWSIPYLVDKDPISDIFKNLDGTHRTGYLS